MIHAGFGAAGAHPAAVRVPGPGCGSCAWTRLRFVCPYHGDLGARGPAAVRESIDVVVHWPLEDLQGGVAAIQFTVTAEFGGRPRPAAGVDRQPTGACGAGRSPTPATMSIACSTDRRPEVREVATRATGLPVAP